MKIGVIGCGVVSAAGSNQSETLQTFETGKRNAGPVSLFSTELTYPVFEAKNVSGRGQKNMRSLDLCIQALEEALEEAGGKEVFKGRRVGVCLGTTVASQLNDIDFYRTYRNRGHAPMDAAERYLNGNLAAAVAEYLEIQGPALVVVNACTSGADAVGTALSWLRADLCDAAIAGGADELNRVPLCGFGSLGILSEELCRPFDRDRAGLNLGEGAGILILEKKETPVSLLGYGSCSDGYHLTAPEKEGKGLQKAIDAALSDAGLSPEDICFVNAHGTATRDNDLVEGAVLSKTFGPMTPFISTKGLTGHTLGAAGGLEAAFTVMALKQGWMPSSAGFEHPDPEIAAGPAAERTVINGKYGVSTSLGFGGNNAVLVFGCSQPKESLL